MNKENLEERLIDFAVLILKVINDLPKNKEANHLSNQLIRSGTSPALNYGEARSAESLKDFIHKLQIVLKELRESFIALKIISKADLYLDDETLNRALAECNELISIFVKSVQTASQKKRN